MACPPLPPDGDPGRGENNTSPLRARPPRRSQGAPLGETTDGPARLLSPQAVWFDSEPPEATAITVTRPPGKRPRYAASGVQAHLRPCVHHPSRHAHMQPRSPASPKGCGVATGTGGTRQLPSGSALGPTPPRRYAMSPDSSGYDEGVRRPNLHLNADGPSPGKSHRRIPYSVPSPSNAAR